MKKLLAGVAVAAILLSCDTESSKGKFTLTGEMKNIADQKIYLEEIYFSEKPAEVLDTGEIKNGKFTVTAIAPEEGLYRLRLGNSKGVYLFINDAGKMNFTADANKQGLSGYSFSGSANSSLKKLLLYTDSIGSIISTKDRQLSEYIKNGMKETDSTFKAETTEYTALKDNYTKYCFAYADTATNPMVSLFSATMAPVEINKFEAPLISLSKRFPDHQGIIGALSFVKTQITPQTQAQPPVTASPTIGNTAPELTMNDVNGNPFSLSQLRGKYVLVDFWASWCGPCRNENPNVVAAYNQFKDKNFTVLGVSLDKDKAAWLNAIKEDHLTWQHISDLKYWSSAAVGLFGFDGIPYNVLLDPKGKIIATGLRESALQDKLAEVLK